MTQLVGKWKLIEAAGQHISIDSEFEFDAEEKRLNYGYGNRYFQSYEVDGNNVTFGPAAGTLMFIQLKPPEHVVNQAINSSTVWAVDGDTLTLSKEGRINAVLKRI